MRPFHEGYGVSFSDHCRLGLIYYKGVGYFTPDAPIGSRVAVSPMEGVCAFVLLSSSAHSCQCVESVTPVHLYTGVLLHR